MILDDEGFKIGKDLRVYDLGTNICPKKLYVYWASTIKARH